MMAGMMNVSQRDMSTHMEMFDHHQEIRRKVEHLANGIRTVVFEALRRHADEVSGFVREGMPAMMKGMMR